MELLVETENDDEFERNLKVRVSINSDVLKWWASNKQQNPILSAKARTYLQVPATSALIESMFSEVKYTYTPPKTKKNWRQLPT